MGSLHQCLRERRYQQFLYLVRLEADPDELDERLHTPLIRLCNDSALIPTKMTMHLMRLLIENGADTLVTDEEGLSLLHIATKNNRADLVKELLSIKRDLPLNNKDMFGNTPLHYATSHESTKVTSLLLPQLIRYKMNIDERNKLGFTPLLIAASNGRLGGTRLLHQTGRVSSDITDSLYFKTTYDWLAIYYDWKDEESILLDGTKFSTRDTNYIQIEKLHLTPVKTTPPANSLLEDFSRRQTAVNNKKPIRTRSTIIPKIVITRQSAGMGRPNTAPESYIRRYDQKSFTNHRVPPLNIHSSRTVDYTATQSHRTIDHTRQSRRTVDYTKSPPLDTGIRSTTTHTQFISDKRDLVIPYTRLSKPEKQGSWNELVSMVNMTSDQLSKSYRPTITPVWPEKENTSTEHVITLSRPEGTRTKDILLGVLGKVRKQTVGTTKEDTVPTIEEEGAGKSGGGGSLKVKMLKYAAMRRTLSTNPE